MSIDRRRRSCQSTELSEQISSCCCNKHPDNQRYSCIASLVVLQMAVGKLLACVVGSGGGGGGGSSGCGGCGSGDSGYSGDLSTMNRMMLCRIVIV